MRGNSPTAVVIFVFLFLGLFGNPPVWADLNPGDTLGQANWQEAKGRLPDPVLRRFQDGSYQAKVIALPASLSWGSKFKAASAANAGKGQKPHDIFGVSLCRSHHDEQHHLGTRAFNRKYRVDLWALAAEFARRSPDWEMRAALKLVRAEQIGGGSAGS